MKVRFEGCYDRGGKVIITMELPEGYKRVYKGKIQKGDSYWYPREGTFVDCKDTGRIGDIGYPVIEMQCVLRKIDSYKPCINCGDMFKPIGNKKTCSKICALEHRKQYYRDFHNKPEYKIYQCEYKKNQRKNQIK